MSLVSHCHCGKLAKINTVLCVICLEETPAQQASYNSKNKTGKETETSLSMVIMLDCKHGACQECMINWFEFMEKASKNVPQCPGCRRVVDQDEAHQILGRPFGRQEQEEKADPAWAKWRLIRPGPNGG